MISSRGDTYDFFLSWRGSVAGIAREVADVLNDEGYSVFIQDYDIPLGASFIEAMHEGIKNSRDLIILYTYDYESSPYTRKEFTSFEAERAQSAEERHVIVLRCEDAPVRGLLADNVYQDLVGVEDPQERRRRIIAAAERQSHAAPPPPRPFDGVPPRMAGFIGRAQELDRLDALLVQEKPAVVTQAVGRAAVRGMGGVGKTSLAIEYVHRFRNLYGGIWWCSAETRVSLMTRLAALAVKLGIAVAEEPDAERAARAALGWLAEQRSTWLLVYDNVTAPEEIADLLPTTGARVLITSRFSDWSGWAEEIALDVLPIDEAVAFLQSRAERIDEPGAHALADALGRLPLALDHAAATCRRTGMSFADYAANASELIGELPRGLAYPRSIAATFDLAIAEAAASCPAADALMAFLAQCAPEPIPMTLVEGAIEDGAQLRKALMALAEVSLLKDDPFEDSGRAVTVHRLVQAAARARSQVRGTAESAINLVLARLYRVYPDDGYDNPGSWPLCQRLTPHVLLERRGTFNGVTDTVNAPQLLDQVASYFHGRAMYSDAALLFRRALAMCEDVLGPEHSATRQILNNLGLVLQDMDKPEEATTLLERALAISEKTFGRDHLLTALSLNNLANLRSRTGDPSHARSLHERALAIREKALGADHPDTAVSLNNLAGALEEQGDFAKARALYERALVFARKPSAQNIVRLRERSTISRVCFKGKAIS